MRSSAVIILFCLFAGESRADKVDDYVKAQMEQRRIPGLALALVKDGRVTKTEAYGFANLEVKAPAGRETVFEIGSITKQFTAALILMLVEEGKLSLDGQINRFFTNAPQKWSDISIRHLLTHTSGLKNYTGLPGFEVTRKLDAQK